MWRPGDNFAGLVSSPSTVLQLRMRDFLNIYFNYVYCVYAHKAIFPESGVTGSCEHPNMGATNKLKLSFVRAVHTQPLSHDSSPPK